MDNRPLNLPDWLADSLESIRTYIECIAMKKERVLWTLQVDEQKVDLAEPELDVRRFSQVRASTISFADLSNHLISAGRDKARELSESLEEAVLLVLINDGSVAQRLWHDWEPQLAEPLFSLRALQELKLPRFQRLFQKRPLAEYFEQLSFIIWEVESLFRTCDDDPESANLIAFSEILDFTLVPWLRAVDDYFNDLE